jgi:C4-dicarboxylate-specific signal transduction histidine kinase
LWSETGAWGWRARSVGGGDFGLTVLKLFTPFVSTKPAGKGTGLGLWLTLGIVTKMDGAVRAANVLGGACFEIELPFVRLNAKESREPYQLRA